MIMSEHFIIIFFLKILLIFFYNDCLSKEHSYHFTHRHTPYSFSGQARWSGVLGQLPEP